MIHKECRQDRERREISTSTAKALPPRATSVLAADPAE
jgi:hypothetical protein